MKQTQIISWIFLAISIASQKRPAEVKSISFIADGIDHNIPTKMELKISFDWLLKQKLIFKKDGKYKLTKNGENMYEFACIKAPYALDAWKNLAIRFQRMK